MTANIIFENVCKSFGKKKAVRNLSISVDEGDLYAFLGPNGAGKTTSIKMLTGLLSADSGSIEICGENIRTKGNSIRRKLCYIPDQPFLYEYLSGREFLQFVGKLFGMSGKDMNEKIAMLADQFGTGDYLDEPAGAYSHGMKQRVVVMAGLLHDPQVIILDEPMVGLDPRLIRRFKDILKERTRNGATVFMSTHNLSDAREMADKIGIIHLGNLVAEGTADEIIRMNGHKDLEDVFLQLTEGDTTVV